VYRRDDPMVVALVLRAREGDTQAWGEIVDRYAPLVWSICRRLGLTRPDADDVGQSVWLRLVEHLPTIRDPAALPGWLVTTTRRECLRVLRTTREHQPLYDSLEPAGGAVGASGAVEHHLLAAEREATLRAGFACLDRRCQQLLALLVADPPLPYAQIGAKLGMPIGSIGPNRARCLDKLRRSPPLAALIRAESGDLGGERHGEPVVER
jgi:RNA polymerase sigma factor (sigma-70 family)